MAPDLEGEEDAAKALLEELGDGDMPETDVALVVALQVLIEEAEASPLLEDGKLALYERARALAGTNADALEDFTRELDDVNPDLPELSQPLARPPPSRGVEAPPTQDWPGVASAALTRPPRSHHAQNPCPPHRGLRAGGLHT